jgi:hypothetical protein
VQKKLFCFSNYKKPIKKARKNYNRRESFSSFLIIGDHEKIWSRAKTIWYALIAPPPFPPFPPQSSVFQRMRLNQVLKQGQRDIVLLVCTPKLDQSENRYDSAGPSLELGDVASFSQSSPSSPLTPETTRVTAGGSPDNDGAHRSDSEWWRRQDGILGREARAGVASSLFSPPATTSTAGKSHMISPMHPR